MSNTTGMYVIKPSGVLIGATSNNLLQEVHRCLETNPKVLLIDLHDVNFIDSSGLGTLVSIHAKLRLAGRRLCLCSLNEQAKGLLDIADLDQTFEIYTNRDEFHAVMRSGFGVRSEIKA